MAIPLEALNVYSWVTKILPTPAQYAEFLPNKMSRV